MIITCLHEQLGKKIYPHMPTCGQLCMMSVLTPVKLSILGLLFQDFKIHHVYIQMSVTVILISRAQEAQKMHIAICFL